jgi:uncharacterized membrane protein YgaE (UPF0421/DUF939 family)
MTSVVHIGRRRLHGRVLPIVQAAVAAVAAWLLAGALVAESRPAFAAIAAVICVGVTQGRRGERAVQLAGGVVIGICAATLLMSAIGPGVPQLGVMVVLAMVTAALLGGGEMVIVEAGVSAILLVTLDPGAAGEFSGDRILEALIGGASALAVGAVLFPSDPVLNAGRSGQAVYAALGQALQRVAAGLERRDPDESRAALEDARAIDPLLAEAREALDARERLAPRSARREIERYERSLGQVDLAVRNTRVLARDAARLARAGEPPAGVPSAIRLLEGAVWELAAAHDDPPRAEIARRRALAAAARAENLEGARPELVGQVRSTAADLVRAAELVADDEPLDRPTEELLAAANPA